MTQATFSPTDENKISPTIHRTSIEGLFFLPHKYIADNRGFYSELARIPEIEAVTGESFMVKQFNQSKSNQNVVRGIHAEDWNKLITVTSGLCFCALVDLRPESATFSKYESFYLGTEDQALKGSLFVKSGIGNSFCVIKGPADYIYAVDAIWSERNVDNDKAVALFDQDINIQWPIEHEQMIYSQRDYQGISLKEMFPEKF